MFNILKLLSLLYTVNSALAIYSGPYLLWGVNRLEHLQLPALEAIDKGTLTSMYSEAKAVVMFIRNSTNRLDQQQFPNFKDLIARNKWVYLPQNCLPADPVDYNSNVDIISLVGPPSQQDIELSALYKDAETIYGQGEVLGILANQAEDGHFIYKRETGEKDTGEKGTGGKNTEEKDTGEKGTEEKGTEEKDTPKEDTEGKETKEKDTGEKDTAEQDTEEKGTDKTEDLPKEQPLVENSIYQASHGILYTSSPPKLALEEDDLKVQELTTHGVVTEDTRQTLYRLSISFKHVQLSATFRFPISQGYWSLNEVELEVLKDGNTKKLLMAVVGDPPSAPLGFSYTCPRELVFRNKTNYLKLKDIQVQPLLAEKQEAFSDAYNCIGFMTAPIWSGIFVSSIILFGTFVGIIALMDIKTPNRFESNRNKQLTFTVQD